MKTIMRQKGETARASRSSQSGFQAILFARPVYPLWTIIRNGKQYPFSCPRRWKKGDFPAPMDLCLSIFNYLKPIKLRRISNWNSLRELWMSKKASQLRNLRASLSLLARARDGKSEISENTHTHRTSKSHLRDCKADAVWWGSWHLRKIRELKTEASHHCVLAFWCAATTFSEFGFSHLSVELRNIAAVEKSAITRNNEKLQMNSK